MSDEMTMDSQPEGPAPAERATNRRRLRHPLLAAMVVAVVLIGAGVASGVAVSQDSSSGAGTPEQAVQNLLTAADNSDVLGALDALAPGERAAIEPGLQGLVQQLQRLNVLSASASLDHVAGVSMQFSGVQMTTTNLTPDLAAVSITSGRYATTSNLAQLPFGSFVQQHAASVLHGTKSDSGTASTGNSVIATVQVGGSWYVSLGETIAVNALRARGETGAPPSGGIAPTGSPTATGVVNNFLQSVASFDLKGVIADLAPDEMGALQLYAPDFLPSAEQSLTAAAASVHVAVSNVHLSTVQEANGTLVKIDSLDLAVTHGPDSFTFANGCVNLVEPGRPTVHHCGSDAGSSTLLPAWAKTIAAELTPIAQRFHRNPPDVGIMTVEENGTYYLSPVRTLFQDLDAFLGDLQPSDLTTIATAYQQALQQLTAAELGGGTLQMSSAASK